MGSNPKAGEIFLALENRSFHNTLNPQLGSLGHSLAVDVTVDVYPSQGSNLVQPEKEQKRPTIYSPKCLARITYEPFSLILIELIFLKATRLLNLSVSYFHRTKGWGVGGNALLYDTLAVGNKLRKFVFRGGVCSSFGNNSGSSCDNGSSGNGRAGTGTN